MDFLLSESVQHTKKEAPLPSKKRASTRKIRKSQCRENDAMVPKGFFLLEIGKNGAIFGQYAKRFFLGCFTNEIDSENCRCNFQWH